MSGIEPGRPKIEEREAAFIWNGTRILTENGVEWTVFDIEPDTATSSLMLHVERSARRHDGQEYTIRSLQFHEDTDRIRCRVEDEDR